ncbi:MAG TPA: hypothetical protein VMZ26_11735 [Pyrinomonadaceae bacterium]|nr:hypothetical protein [Pyrinomonadaceae bacterium]
MSEKSLEHTRSFDNEIVFESYGVRVRIQTTSPELLEDAERTARKALLDRLEILESKEAEHTFRISADENETMYLFLNGEQVSYDKFHARFFKFFNGILRIVVAEHARDTVFIHAGVVGWRGKAIVIPANSFEGKTTLVAELVRNGAEYYSDEYAVLDRHGMVHPFPRDLSVRDDEFRETDVPVEALGGKTGTTALPIGAVLLTRYEENAGWNPERLTVGQGIMEIIPHTIPRIFNTKFSLKVLNTAVSDAIILKSPRGDAGQLAIKLLSFFDNFIYLAKIT